MAKSHFEKPYHSMTTYKSSVVYITRFFQQIVSVAMEIIFSHSVVRFDSVVEVCELLI